MIFTEKSDVSFKEKIIQRINDLGCSDKIVIINSALDLCICSCNLCGTQFTAFNEDSIDNHIMIFQHQYAESSHRYMQECIIHDLASQTARGSQYFDSSINYIDPGTQTFPQGSQRYSQGSHQEACKFLKKQTVPI
ncbi:unnamed protein product [Meloidogyne enterolobii]|uniref:Uncharacterized protein n=2 Tax=Meloidogyne enterolobii TaxID=390850 RepID=A0A6V7X073_MELEN|nr:unnamed protein product [Meloidogyne enterolobii]